MKKVLLSALLIFSIFLLSSCTKDEKFYLEDKYYGNGEYIEMTSDEFKTLGKTNYILFTYNDYCQFQVPCDNIFQEFIDEYDISIIKMPYDEFKKTSLHNKVKYAPSIVVVKNGKVADYLDASDDDDVDLYQDSKKFADWLNNYVYLEKK